MIMRILQPIRSKHVRPSFLEGRLVSAHQHGINTAYSLGFSQMRHARNVVLRFNCSCYVLVKFAYFWYHKRCTKTARTLSLTPSPVSKVKTKGGDDD